MYTHTHTQYIHNFFFFSQSNFVILHTPNTKSELFLNHQHVEQCAIKPEINIWKRFGFNNNDGQLNKTVAICKLCRPAIK